MGIVREHGVYMDLEDAVLELKRVRLISADGFIPRTRIETLYV
jgi:hypothetical protein